MVLRIQAVVQVQLRGRMELVGWLGKLLPRDNDDEISDCWEQTPAEKREDRDGDYGKEGVQKLRVLLDKMEKCFEEDSWQSANEVTYCYEMEFEELVYELRLTSRDIYNRGIQ